MRPQMQLLSVRLGTPRGNRGAEVAQVVLVHGGWHGAWCWDAVIAELRTRDVTVAAP
jgi:hypothetical protein